ncbi:hypothetical protein EYF80_043390 [Liparis tanakae]|uniref:Uncharacterized protein n=1 Tax=Liparis tanakae TaxID=230148 RepID=A0A4Z2G0R1_9TELE|nr:hypothetical protein EYF80_043390 [Liparis tanakae]
MDRLSASPVGGILGLTEVKSLGRGAWVSGPSGAQGGCWGVFLRQVVSELQGRKPKWTAADVGRRREETLA